jgi:transposase
MAILKKLKIKESLSEIKRLQQKSPLYLSIRLQMLIVIKTKEVHSKRGLSDILGISANSIQAWKQLYSQGGIDKLMEYHRGGNKKPVIDAKADKAIVAKLSNPYEAPRSYKELQQWVDEHLIKGINYHTLNKHVKNKHKTKLKVVRKSHVKKDEQAVAAFKKNRRVAGTY